MTRLLQPRGLARGVITFQCIAVSLAPFRVSPLLPHSFAVLLVLLRRPGLLNAVALFLCKCLVRVEMGLHIALQGLHGRLHLMFRHVLALRHGYQIFRAIVATISVDVMHDFSWLKPSCIGGFPIKAMFSNVAAFFGKVMPWNPHQPIALLVLKSPAIPQRVKSAFMSVPANQATRIKSLLCCSAFQGWQWLAAAALAQFHKLLHFPNALLVPVRRAAVFIRACAGRLRARWIPCAPAAIAGELRYRRRFAYMLLKARLQILRGVNAEDVAALGALRINPLDWQIGACSIGQSISVADCPAEFSDNAVIATNSHLTYFQYESGFLSAVITKLSHRASRILVHFDVWTHLVTVVAFVLSRDSVVNECLSHCRTLLLNSDHEYDYIRARIVTQGLF